MAINLPADWGIVDLRQPILGDSFSWAGVEPAAAKKSIVIHGTASEAINEDGFTMAEYHVNHNGWGGIGVHFVVTKDEYPGRPGVTSPGAQIQYVGDLSTWRAGCANQNPGRVHIEISGLFTNRTPSEQQLRLVRRLMENLMAPNMILPSINYFSQLTYHNAVPGQSTACPGWQFHFFNEWFGFLQGGPNPSWWGAPPPAPISSPPVPAPEPAPNPQPVQIPVETVDNRPEWEKTWEAKREDRQVFRDGAYAVDVTNGQTKAQIPKNKIVEVGGYFSSRGTTYARTVWASANNSWNGIPVDFFESEVIPVPITVTPTPPVVSDPMITPPATEDLFGSIDFTDLGDEVKEAVDSNWSKLWVNLKEIVAILLSPVLIALGKKEK